jgi:archaemetzincin
MQQSNALPGELMSNNRSRRSSFPGTEPAPVEGFDLPAEPLPPEPRELEEVRPGSNAPIVLVPVGKIEDGILDRIQPALEETFRRPTTIHGSLPVPKYAYNPTRTQYHSAAILKRVETLRSIEWDAAIGLVDVDLFVPEVPFIFGEADRSTRSAIISLTRLRPETGTTESKKDLLLKRLICEAIHQIGLIRGLAQCPNNRCVMFYSATVQDTDKKGQSFCANCRKRLLSES